MPGSYPAKISLTALLVIFTVSAGAQFRVSATELLSRKNYNQPVYEKKHVSFLGSESNSALVKYNPFTLAFGSLLYVYQGVLSQQVSAECRFRMSCSGFSKAAIQEFGLVKGIALTSDRIMKCNRLAMVDARPGDYDEYYRLFDTPQKYRIRH